MINHEHRAIFVHIQKTGGSSITKAFGWKTNPSEKHFRADQLKALYGEEAWENYFKFTIVRNPWDRLVSWWSMIDPFRVQLEKGRQLNGFLSYVLATAQTFPEFLHKCTDEICDPDGEKQIFRNQIDYLADSDGKLMVDYVGRFETLTDDFQQIADRIGLRSNLPHANASRRADYRSYYTDDLAQLVADKYARDITTFNYTF